jgi:hypothetical protein
MIVCDTTSVNTGRKGGVVVRLQNEFLKKSLPKPQFIGCQHHILDLILRHLLDFCTPTPSQKPEINYPYVNLLVSQYDHLQTMYVAQDPLPIGENPGWRDDFKFLYELCEAYKYFKTSGRFPVIQWRKLPSLHNARWNSRTTYALLAYFLLPQFCEALRKACDFISTTWAVAWFSNQHYNDRSYDDLFTSISQLGCEKALKSFTSHWSNERSIIDIPRSNIVAERAVKVMEGILEINKSEKYLQYKFLNSNMSL